jgi:hypothetical protein
LKVTDWPKVEEPGEADTAMFVASWLTVWGSVPLLSWK